MNEPVNKTGGISGNAKETLLPADLAGSDGYKLITGLIVPRPIGWIGSLSPSGANNLAPYSFFNAVSADPPMVVFSAGQGQGVRRDSADNIRASGEFTVNIVTVETVEAMNATSASLPPDGDEFALAGLTPMPGKIVDAPLVAEARAQLECRVAHLLPIGREGGGSLLIVGEVVAFHIEPELLDGTRINQDQLRAVGRHAGNSYSVAEPLFEIVRPE